MMNRWITEAVNQIEADYHRSADTHLFKLNVPALQGVHLYLKLTFDTLSQNLR